MHAICAPQSPAYRSGAAYSLHPCRLHALRSMPERRALAATPPTTSSSLRPVNDRALSTASHTMANAVSCSEYDAAPGPRSAATRFAAESSPDRDTSLPFTVYGRGAYGGSPPPSAASLASDSIRLPHGDGYPRDRPNWSNICPRVMSSVSPNTRHLRDRPGATRHELAAVLGCSEQTVQRRLEHNNVRGGKPIPGTRVLQTSAMVAEWASAAGLYLYDKRVWHKDPAWMSCRWHTVSYRAVDEYEHVLVFWNPGITEYDRGRLTASEWREWGSRGVWNIRSVARNSRHEAEFPEELARRVVRLFSPPGGTVLDPFVGTGTTTAVAAMEGRRWVGIERNRRHADMASARTRSLLPGAPPPGGEEPGRPPGRPE